MAQKLSGDVKRWTAETLKVAHKRGYETPEKKDCVGLRLSIAN